jgi:hypothetical protein
MVKEYVRNRTVMEGGRNKGKRIYEGETRFDKR